MKFLYEPKHARCYCALTVGAVAAVASTGIAAYGAYSQSKAQDEAAAQAQSGLGGDPTGAYGSKIELPQWSDQIGEGPVGKEMLYDYSESLPLIFQISAQMNERAKRMRNKMSGGRNFSDALEQQGENINSMLRGEIPTDVADVINRTVAERMGATFDPNTPGGFAGGMSQTGSSLARSLGRTSMDIMDKGMTYAPEWEKLVDSFTYTPGKVIDDSATFLSAATLQLQRDKAKYEAGVQSAIAEGQPNPQVSGAINDRLRLDTISSQAEANKMRALAGLVTAGVGGATSVYNQFKPASTTGGAMTAANARAVTTPGTWQSSAYGVK